MNSRNTWTLVALAAGLFAFIFFYERHAFTPETLRNDVLPYFKTGTVTSVQVLPAGVKEIRADRTNGNWKLTKPLAYPAQAGSIEQLLETLGKLKFQARITAHELKSRPNAGVEFGFDNPLFSIVLLQGESGLRIKIGKKTELRDQVFLQVVGDEGIYLVDASVLNVFPRQANDWRDTLLLNLKGLAVDRLVVTNSSRVMELQRDAADKPWRMVQPMKARADNPRIGGLLQNLTNLRVSQFVTDDAKADLAGFGLQPAELELVIGQGTNELAVLQFGKSPSTNASVVYARRRDQPSVVLLPIDQVNPWRVDQKDFKDRYLVDANSGAVVSVESRGDATFTVQRQTNGIWSAIAPESFVADAGLVRDLLAGLTGLQVTEFTKDVVTEPGLINFGLAKPVRQYILRGSETNRTPGATDPVIAQLDFGAISNNLIYVRRPDESSVYAVKVADYQRLATDGWQLRDRRIWNFNTNDVLHVSIHQNGQVRQLVRNAANQWSLAPGSQGVIDYFAVEETLYRLGTLTAAFWVDRGDQNRERFGFSDKTLQLEINVKRGDLVQTLKLEFGGLAPTKYPYAAVTLEGRRWTFEFPWLLYQQILYALTIPNAPSP